VGLVHGWFNLIGLLAVVASVDYACATFATVLLNLWSVDIGILNFADEVSAGEVFTVFALVIALHARSTSTPPTWWRCSTTSRVLAPGRRHGDRADPYLRARPPPERRLRLHRENNLNGFSDGMFWFYVLPVGFLLTMYTVTGYDASAHISEETHGADESAPKGVWRSVFYSAVIGWIVLLAITFAATDKPAIDEAFGFSPAIFTSAMSEGWAEMIILISTGGQLFCGMACVTSASRMTYAFSRDRAVPRLADLDQAQPQPRARRRRAVRGGVRAAHDAARAVLLQRRGGGLLRGRLDRGDRALHRLRDPGLLRWRKGDAFQPGPWTLGKKYRWMNPVAFVWVAICVVIFSLPFSPAAVPWRDEFDWAAVNYAPIMVGAVLLGVGGWWLASARHTFKGPVRTVVFDDAAGIKDDEPLEPTRA
jgi:hypothetical protein